ncbi:MAG TPA: hypothetical protein VF077_13355 [Nitrospiraceae bacterium]
MSEQVTTSQEAPEQTGAAAQQAPAADAAGQTAQPVVQPNGQATEEGVKDQQRSTEGYIRRLQAQKARERERAKRLEAENAELKARLQPTASQTAAPDPTQYQDYNQFVRDSAAYEARREAQSLMAHQARAAQEEQARASAIRLESAYEERVDKARADHADFDEAVEFLDSMGVTEQLKPVLHHSEAAGDVLYYLAKHPEELTRIQKLDPVGQVKAIWALEATAKPQPKVTQAPKPIEPVKPAGTTASGYRPGMSSEEYAVYRNKRKGRI